MTGLKNGGIKVKDKTMRVNISDFKNNLGPEADKIMEHCLGKDWRNTLIKESREKFNEALFETRDAIRCFLDFANGCTISVQFSKGNYCDQGETTAEVAVFDKDNNWYILNEEDNHMSLIKVEEYSDVIGHCTTDLVASIIELTRKLK